VKARKARPAKKKAAKRKAGPVRRAVSSVKRMATAAVAAVTGSSAPESALAPETKPAGEGNSGSN
jgi:hypothetical protein